jgi:hypothetical protein
MRGGRAQRKLRPVTASMGQGDGQGMRVLAAEPPVVSAIENPRSREIGSALNTRDGAMGADSPVGPVTLRLATGAWMPASRCRFLATSGKNPEVATVRPPARKSPAGAALRPDRRARILAGFLAVCTRRTRVPQRVWDDGVQNPPGFRFAWRQGLTSDYRGAILARSSRVSVDTGWVGQRLRGAAGMMGNHLRRAVERSAAPRLVFHTGIGSTATVSGGEP